MLPNIVVINITARGKVANDLSGARVRPTKAAEVITSEIALTISPCEIANKGVFLKKDVIIDVMSCRRILFYVEQ